MSQVFLVTIETTSDIDFVLLLYFDMDASYGWEFVEKRVGGKLPGIEIVN